MDLDKQTGLWPHTHIEAHRTLCKQEIADRGTWADKHAGRRGAEFLSGALAVYDWVLGDAPSPFSGPLEPTLEAVVSQERLAYKAIRGERGAPDVVSQGWAVGVENTCIWLHGSCDEPPEGLLPDEEARVELY
jgi:hypothetical protein